MFASQRDGEGANQRRNGSPLAEMRKSRENVLDGDRKVRALRQFDADYNAALAKWMAGDRRAVFPHGTWWMRVHHAVLVHPPP